MIRALLRGHSGNGAVRHAPAEPTLEDQHHGENTMNSLTRNAAAKMMEALQAETEVMKQDVLAEIDYSRSTLNALHDAEREECERIDAEAEARKDATRRMYRQLADIERKRVAHAERRLAHLVGEAPGDEG